MSDIWLLRVGIVIAGVLLMVVIYLIGKPRKPAQGRKHDAPAAKLGRDARREPTIGEGATEAEHEADPPAPLVQGEMPLNVAAPAAASEPSSVGMRPDEEFDKIITLYVAARAGQMLHGPDIVVAAEKAGLTWGYAQVFHRMLEGKPELGPVFSVANVVKPGGFDMADIGHLQTPAIAFFLTLPAPVGALDAWEMMEPAAQRMAELLDGVLLDESRNALGRQRIQMIRDEMRAWDRQREVPLPSKSGRW